MSELVNYWNSFFWVFIILHMLLVFAGFCAVGFIAKRYNRKWAIKSFTAALIIEIVLQSWWYLSR